MVLHQSVTIMERTSLKYHRGQLRANWVVQVQVGLVEGGDSPKLAQDHARDILLLWRREVSTEFRCSWNRYN